MLIGVPVWAMVMASRLEEGQAINVTDGQIVANVKVGTAAVGGKVVGVDEGAVEAIRRIVDGVAVSVGHAEREVTDGAMHRGLHRVVDGVGLIFEARDVAKTLDRATEVRVIAASDAEISQRLP